MNRKVLGIAIVFLITVILATPVLAEPTQGQKASFTLTWTGTGSTLVDQWWSNDVRHRHMHVTWNVSLEIDGVGTINGTATTDRDAVRVPQKDGFNNLLHDYYVLTFDGGGFEGNALIMTQNVNSPTWRGKAHGLFIGTGAFEGQTINGGHHWVQLPVAEIVWTGYLLKP